MDKGQEQSEIKTEGPAKNLSRRGFLKASLGSAAALLGLTEAGQYILHRSPQNESIGSEHPLSGTEFSKYQESQKGKEVNLTTRTTEFLVGHRAWQNNKDLAGFLGRHVEKMNDVLAQTRDGSRIKNLSMRSRTIVVDEDWLQAQDWKIRQAEHSDGTVGRWSIDEKYSPDKSPYYRDGIDYGLLHEWLHYTFYLYPHLYYPFTRSDGWMRYLSVDIPQEKNVRIAEILLWKEREMKKQMYTRMLVDAATTQQPPLPPLSEPEELYIRRMCKGKDKYRDFASVANPQFLNRILTDDIAPEFRFKINGSGKIVRLIAASVEKFERPLEPHWKFENPIVLSPKEGSVSIKKGLLSGVSVIGNPEDPQNYADAKAFILIVGEGEKRQLYGFTGWHLLYWTWKEQFNHGETELGVGGKIYPVQINLADFEI